MEMLSEAGFDMGMLYQFILILVVIVFIAAYKIVRKALEHKQIMAAIEKGVDLSDFNFGKSPKHARSLYLSAFFTVMSIPCILLLIHSIHIEFSDEEVIKVLFITGFTVATAVLFLVRGILLRRVYIKSLAIKNGIPFENLYVASSIRLKGILSLAIGFPIAVVFTVLFCIMIAEASQGGGIDANVGYIITGLMIIGQILLLRGLMVRRAVKKQLRENLLKINNQQPVQPQTEAAEAY